MSVISFKDVWLKYRIEFKEDGNVIKEDFWAVKGINMDIDKGESIAIIGENGAGKTTLLKLIAGMLKPDRGAIQINGTVSTIMEIGAGFHKDLTGRENIYRISSFFGLTKEQIETRYSDITKFAAVGRFINAPVRTYSQGMYMRLAFAIAIHMDPDVLLVDDMLSVGDIYAQRKCIDKMFEIREQGKTLIFVTQDIEMSKRLCTRGIFIREGIVIKEGPIDKLCSYYMESIGDKKGIAILQKGLLGVVFNNGRLILRWKDKTITSHLSGHSVMLFSGRECISTTADWQVQESNTDREIVAIGRWPDLPIYQRWRIVFLNEKEFIWEMTIDASEEISIEKFRTSVIFTNEYKNWFTLLTETGFPERFIHLRQWECSEVGNSLDRVIGLKTNNKAIEPPPIIIFDRAYDNTKMICQVGNTGSEINGRGIVFDSFPQILNNSCIQNTSSKGSYRCFISKIKIFENEEEEKVKHYLDQTRQIMREFTIICRNSLNLFCKDGSIEIYCKDKLVTRDIGLNTKFRLQDKNYSAQDGRWNIHREGSEEIIIGISWDDEPRFIQIWRLRLKEDNVISWEIDIDIREEIKIRNKQIELVLSGDYEKWLTIEEKGDFKKLGRQGNVVLNKYINDCIGVEGAYEIDDFILPGLLFSHDNGAPATSYISKMKEKEIPTTRLRYLEIDCKENFYTPPGIYKYFNSEIKIIANKEIEEIEEDLIKILDKRPNIINQRIRSSGKVECERISLLFDCGKGRLFWRNIELTKALGLYSSVLSGGMWHDSSQASWEIQESEKKRLRVIGRWPWIPMVQTWEVALLDERNILWKITTRETWDKVILEREQVNLMLSDKYKVWFTDKRIYGKFPERFSEHNGLFWDRLWCGDIKSTVGVKKYRFKKSIFDRRTLPSIVFDCSEDCLARYRIIENTDNLFQARVLQYELNPDDISDSGRNKYFDGRIKLIN